MRDTLRDCLENATILLLFIPVAAIGLVMTAYLITWALELGWWLRG
jgi:hypothetical protein